MSKLPAFQFYPADWRKDAGVQALSFQDRGIWFEILCLMHESEQRGKLLLNGRAMPLEALARVLGLDNQTLTTALTNIEAYGVASRDQETGALMCRRMVRDENLRKVRAEAGKKGGNPILLNQKPTTQDKQVPTPSSSSSASASAVVHAQARVVAPDVSGTLPDDGELREELARIVRNRTGTLHNGNAGIEKRVNAEVAALIESGATLQEIQEFDHSRRKAVTLNYFATDFCKWRADRAHAPTETNGNVVAITKPRCPLGRCNGSGFISKPNGEGAQVCECKKGK